MPENFNMAQWLYLFYEKGAVDLFGWITHALNPISVWATISSVIHKYVYKKTDEFKLGVPYGYGDIRWLGHNLQEISERASQQASKQANNQPSKQTTKQTTKQSSKFIIIIPIVFIGFQQCHNKTFFLKL